MQDQQDRCGHGGQPAGYTGILVLNQGGKNNEKKHPGWNQQKWEDLTTYKVAIVLCQEYDHEITAGMSDADWITVHQDYLAARGHARVLKSVQLLEHKVPVAVPSPIQEKILEWDAVFLDHVFDRRPTTLMIFVTFDGRFFKFRLNKGVLFLGLRD